MFYSEMIVRLKKGTKTEHTFISG